jgi:hypothetical protein
LGRLRFAILLLMIAAAMSAGPISPAEASPAVSRTDISDIRGPLPTSGLPPFALTCLELLVAGGLTVIWSKLRRRRSTLAPLTPETVGNPVEILDQWAASYRRGDLPPDFFYLRTAALVRTTLACWTGLPASRLTTGELLDRVAVPELLAAGELALAGQLLTFCDRVKFAGHTPDAVEAEWLLAAARELLGRPAKERHELP